MRSGIGLREAPDSAENVCLRKYVVIAGGPSRADLVSRPDIPNIVTNRTRAARMRALWPQSGRKG